MYVLLTNYNDLLTSNHNDKQIPRHRNYIEYCNSVALLSRA